MENMNPPTPAPEITPPTPLAQAQTSGYRKFLLPGGIIALVVIVIWALLSMDTTINARSLDSSKYFSDPKVAAFVDDVQRGNAKRVKAAIAAGQDPNAQGNEGFRPIHFIFPAKTAEVARILLIAGADPNARMANQNTALHYAVQQPNPDFTAVLLEYRADPNAKGASDEPVLINALSSTASDVIIRMLAKAGADINLVWGGYSPLQAAIVAMQWTSAVTLVELNTDPSVRSSQNENAAELFCRRLARTTPTPTNRQKIVRVGDGINAKIPLSCEAKLMEFR